MTRHVYRYHTVFPCKDWTQFNLMISYNTIYITILYDTILYDTVLYHIVHIYIYINILYYTVYCIIYHIVLYRIIHNVAYQIILSHIYKYTYIIYRGSPYMSPTALRSGTVILVCFRGLYSAWRMEKATWIPWIWSHVEHVTGLLVAWSRMYCNIICIYTTHYEIFCIRLYILICDMYTLCIYHVWLETLFFHLQTSASPL